MTTKIESSHFFGYMDWKKIRVKEEDNLCLSQAIEDFKTKVLTGSTPLTEEEKEKINAIIAQFLEDNPIETEADKSAFLAFVKQLYMKFGDKTDFLDFLMGVVSYHLDSQMDLSARLDLLSRIRSHLTFGEVTITSMRSSLLPIQLQLQGEEGNREINR